MTDFQSYAQKYRTELLQSCVPFWLHYGPDERCGGIRACLDGAGMPVRKIRRVNAQSRRVDAFPLRMLGEGERMFNRSQNGENKK